MSRGPHTFKQRDLTRAIKAVAAAGIKNPVAEIDRDGKLRVFGGDNVTPLPTTAPSVDPETALQEWKAKREGAA
jgi:hypothetical protein